MTTGKKILIIDDDADFAAGLKSFLEANGFQARSAAGSREGLRLAKSEVPDLILMDIMMEERTEGFFAVQEIRRTAGLERIPVFVVSGIYSSSAELGIPPGREWLAHDEFFTKPVDLDRLLSAIRHYTGAAGRGAREATPKETAP